MGPLLLTWSAEPLPWLGVGVAAAGYLALARVVNRAHPSSPVPRLRVAAWLSGVAVIGVALVSAVDVLADDLFSVHMLQHLLLAMVAPPLLALGAPVTLALRSSPPRLRRGILLPLLHSRAVKAVSWPPVGWAAFAIVMWATHFTPLFNAALENELIHWGEHLLYVGAGCLFWWPVIGADPLRWRLGPLARIAYLAAQMPLNTAVGLAIYFAPSILYPHYALPGRTWGPDPLIDQQIAGIVMWGAGDLILLGAVVLGVEAWLRNDERRNRRMRERVAAEADRAAAGNH
jgi:putative copper resistance protein D